MGRIWSADGGPREKYAVWKVEGWNDLYTKREKLHYCHWKSDWRFRIERAIGDLGVLGIKRLGKKHIQLEAALKIPWPMILWITLEWIMKRDCIHPFECRCRIMPFCFRGFEYPNMIICKLVFHQKKFVVCTLPGLLCKGFGSLLYCETSVNLVTSI